MRNSVTGMLRVARIVLAMAASFTTASLLPSGLPALATETPAPAAAPAPTPVPETPPPAAEIPAVTPTPPPAPVRVARSPLAGVTLPHSPSVLGDDGTYSNFMAATARDLNRTCVGLESYGWTFPPRNSDRLNQILNDTMALFASTGFTIKESKPSTITSESMLAFTAEGKNAEGKANMLLLAWSVLGDDAVLLLLCDARPTEPAKTEPAKPEPKKEPGKSKR